MEEKGRIGLPRALMFYRYFPFWSTFFEALGWRVVVSDGLASKKRIIYFEDSCLPMKLFVTHANDLVGKADYLFAPRLISLRRTYILCPKFRAAPDILRLALEGDMPILDETIDLRIGGSSLFHSFLRIGEKLGASRKETGEAFSEAQRFFSTFQKEWIKRINELPAKDLFHLSIPTPALPKIPPPLLGDERGEGVSARVWPPPSFPMRREGCETLRVAFVGHPYNLFDVDINKDALTLSKHLGMEIITSDLLSERILDQEVSDLSKEIYWSSGREIVGALFHFLKGGVDGVIFLTSFKCGIDALLQEFVKRRLKVRGESSVPLLVLSFDEHTGREGLMTRLEAFRDVMEEKKALRKGRG